MKRVALCVLALSACSPPVGPTSGYAIDGDTFVSNGVHYRLSRVDAPEMPGHCRPGRHCVPGDPFQAKNVLQAFLDNGVTCRQEGLDYYHRTLVSCVTWQHRDLGATLIQFGVAEEYHRS